MADIFGNNYSLIQYLVGVVSILCGIHIGKIVRNFWIDQSRLRKAMKLFPGPRTIPIIGNTLELIAKRGELVNFITELCKEHPLNHIYYGPRLIINVSTPEDIEIVMKSAEAAKKSFIYDFLRPVMTDSLLNGHGPKYRAHRKLLVPMINGEHLIYYMEAFNRQCHRYVDTLAKKVDSGEFDIYCETEYCMADMAFETVIGIPGVGQDFGDLTFPHAETECLDIFYHRTTTLWLHPKFLFNFSSTGKTWNKHVKYMTDFLMKIINEKRQLYKALINNEPGIQKPKPSILDLLIENIVLTNAMDDSEIVSEITTVFVGFYDTILGTYAFAMFMLAMHQEAQKKVREEVIAVLGSNMNVMDEHLGALKYTDMVIRETIRLFPIGSFLPREAINDFKLSNYTVPKGATVAMVPFVTHRSEKYWDKPDAFIPERFFPENSINRHPFAFIPFSGGLRSCPGSKFGVTCLKVAIAQTIRNYQLTTTKKLNDIKLTQNISIRSANGYPVAIKKIAPGQL